MWQQRHARVCGLHVCNHRAAYRAFRRRDSACLRSASTPITLVKGGPLEDSTNTLLAPNPNWLAASSRTPIPKSWQFPNLGRWTVARRFT